jgi:DNA-binding transcriptional LysR family regulator
VHIVEAMTGGLEEWILSGKLDVALLYNHRPYDSVVWTETVAVELLLIGAAGSPIARRRSVAFAELSDLPMTLPGAPNELRKVIEQLASKAGTEPNIAVDCDSLPGIVQLVRRGYFTVLPEFAEMAEIARGEIVAVPLVEPTPSWRLSVVRAKATHNAHSSLAVARLMEETIGSMVEKGLWRARL